MSKPLSDYKRLLLTAFVMGEVEREGNEIRLTLADWEIYLSAKVIMAKENTRRCMFYKNGALVKDVVTEFQIPDIR